MPLHKEISIRRAILKYLEITPNPITGHNLSTVIAGQLNVNERSVYNSLKNMHEQGELIRGGEYSRYHYSLPDQELTREEARKDELGKRQAALDAIYKKEEELKVKTRTNTAVLVGLIITFISILIHQA